MRPVPSPFRSPRRVRITHMSDRPRGCHGTGRLRITAQASAPRAARLVISPAPAGLWQTAATSAGRCDCCSTPYPAGTPIVWDSVVAGWVLAGHRGAGSRR